MAKEYFGFLDGETSLGFSDGEFYRYGDSLNKTVRLNDEDYRFFIKAKVMKNYQDGTLENIIDSIQYLTGENSNIIDKQDMTMNIAVNGNSLNSIKLYAIKFLDILVRPIGVHYRFLIITNDEPFGFSLDSTAFGFAKFVRLQSIGIQ